MPDWQRLVRRRLQGMALEEDEVAQIVEELANHFEDRQHALVREGVSERAAIRQCLRQVNDWQDLQKKVESSRREELPMTKRVTQFWFPAFITLFLAMVLLLVIQEIGPKPYIAAAWIGRPRMTPLAVVYGSWLATLPFIGALGAYLSKRAGGSLRAVFLAIVFPVLPYLAFMMIGLPIALLLDDHVAHNITIPAFFVGFSAWVVFPGAALLAGGLPVHYYSARLRAPGVASN